MVAFATVIVVFGFNAKEFVEKRNSGGGDIIDSDIV